MIRDRIADETGFIIIGSAAVLMIRGEHLLKSKKSKILILLKISTKIFGFYISLHLR